MQELKNVDESGNNLNTETDKAIDLFQKAFDEIDKLQNKDLPPEGLVEDEAPEIDHNTNEAEEPDEGIEEGSGEIEPVAKVKKPQKPWQIKRDKYRLAAKLAEANAEIAQLKASLNDERKVSINQYSKNVYSDLERAKVFAFYSFRAGNEDAYLDSTLAINQIQLQIHELEKLKNTSDNVNRESANEQADYNALHEEIANDWLESHPYLQSSSKSYNPQLRDKVDQFVQKLDIHVAKNYPDEYFSENYFKAIDNYIDTLKAPKPQRNDYTNGANYVGGVKNSHNLITSSTHRPNQIKLTQEEKEFAASLNLTDEQYLKSKLKYMK